MKPKRYWSQSTLAGGCNKAISYVQSGFRPRQEDNFLTAGSALHLYDALRNQGVDEDTASLRAMGMMNQAHVKPTIPWLTAGYVSNMCEAWEADRSSRNPVISKPNGEACVEFSLAYPIRETEDVIDIGTGTLDGLERLPTEFIAVRDIKTTMKWEVDLRQYERSAQFLHYPWLMRELALAKPDSWFAREVYHALRCINIYSVRMLKAGVSFNQHCFNINWQLVSEYGDLLKRFVESFVPGLPTGLVTGSCMSGKDYVCNFFDICHTNRTENYEQVEYNPILRHRGSRVKGQGTSEDTGFQPGI